MMQKSAISRKKSTNNPAWHHRFLFIVMLCFWLFTVSSSFATTWYVNDSVAGDGTSWASTFSTIQDAVTAAASGDEIWVKEGTYLITDEITINKAITLYGRFPDAIPSPTMDAREPSAITTIDGQGSTDVSHCLYLIGGGITVDGFKITGGNHSTLSSPPPTQYLGGGGIVMYQSNNNTIRNCMIIANQSNNAGAGMVINESTGTTIENCSFEGNTVTGGGGGALAIRDVSGTTSISGCSFFNNTCTANGGAIYHFSDYDDFVTISDSSFTSNRSTYSGGALMMSGSFAISGCSFTGNSATNQDGGYGGAIYATDDYQGVIENCTFENNSAYDYRENGGGGAIFFWASTGPGVEINNSSFSFDLNPPPLVEDPERFYRSGVK